jgi:hypothetical protein
MTLKAIYEIFEGQPIWVVNYCCAYSQMGIKSIHLGCSIKNLEEHYHLPHEVDFTRSLSLFATLEPCVVFIPFLAQAKLYHHTPFFNICFLAPPHPNQCDHILKNMQEKTV